MLVLGLSGGPEPVYNHRLFPTSSFHDAAAVLVEDGKVVAALEEERRNRIKHTNKFPSGAIRFCMEATGVRLGDVDRFAIYGREDHYSAFLKRFSMSELDDGHFALGVRQLLCLRFKRDLGETIEEDKLCFVPHHLAHAVSAFYPSGFDQSLVVTIDGMGDGLSGTAMLGFEGTLKLLRAIPMSRSLGHFYSDVCHYLGFQHFDEYKVMGLAPYGDPARARHLFDRLLVTGPEGEYQVISDRIPILGEICERRKKNDPISDSHKDIAAGLQEALERIVFHVLSFFRKATKQTSLCMAGGVAHNCSLNGKILRSGIFERVFVQPASHDAGCALGAALEVCRQVGKKPRFKPLDHVYWGTATGNADEIVTELSRWTGLVSFVRSNDVAEDAASLLAAGKIIGWMQGRSEFGPRALGNRSILADPRPAKNKDIVNAIVKKREAFRPFAPAVLEERASDFFELPKGVQALPHMIFVVGVRQEKRSILGAVTHVDGTARLQTVSQETNPAFWRVIAAFGKLTGIPIVLNTSFNNNAEPIVDSVADAIVCFLTTGLDHLVVGDYLVSKQDAARVDVRNLIPFVPAHVELRKVKKWVSLDRQDETFSLAFNDGQVSPVPISRAVHDILCRANGKLPVWHLSGDAVNSQNDLRLNDELVDLWGRRMIRLLPL